MRDWTRVATSQTQEAQSDLWAMLLDGRRWATWYPGIEWMVVEGELAAGNFLTIKPKGWLQTAFRIVDVEPQKRLSIATQFGPLATLTFQYAFSPEDGGCQIAFRVRITGPLAQVCANIAGARLESSLRRAVASFAAL